MLNRRSILAGLAAAATAATGTTASAAQVTENPELIALGDSLPRALERYQRAAEAVRKTVETWGPQWPTPDPEIIWHGSGSKRHADIQGRGIETPWGKANIMRVQNLGTPEAFAAEHQANVKEAQRRAGFKSQRGMASCLDYAERMKARIAPARAYWSEVERITAASGIEAATAAKMEAQDALRAAVHSIMVEPDRTMTGLAIKAQALAAWSHVDPLPRTLNPDAPRWADEISASIMRHAA